MAEKLSPTTIKLMDERFGHDTLLSVATTDGNTPYVRTVNAYYEEGSFYVITYALSGKMRQIETNPTVAVCGDWFTAHGIGENMGHIHAKENEVIAAKLRHAFASWLDNGHTDESDSNTVILRIRLTEGTLASHGTWYNIDFTS